GGGGEDELRDELLDVAGVDLIEGAVAPAGVRAVVHEPVGAVIVRLQQAVEGDVTPVRGGRRGGQEQHDSEHDEHESYEWAHTDLPGVIAGGVVDGCGRSLASSRSACRGC